MRHFSIIALAAVTAFFLTLAPAQAGKFKNKDTAKDRQDNVFGTDQGEANTQIIVEENEQGATVIRSKPAQKEEVDWYDKTNMKLDVDLEKQIED